jgi:hypothetical protein
MAAMGCHAVVVPTAAPNLAAMAAGAGVKALGERSFGLALPGIGLNATLAHLHVPKGRLALMAQSSAIARAVIDWAAAEGLGFSHIIGIGSNEDLGFALGLDWLARDSSTACVLLELRRIKQRRRFVSAARATARTRPVLALRPGGRTRRSLGHRRRRHGCGAAPRRHPARLRLRGLARRRRDPGPHQAAHRRPARATGWRSWPTGSAWRGSRRMRQWGRGCASPS